MQRHLENPPETVYLSKDDSNERLVSERVYFFIDTGWVRRNINGTYAFTTKCKNVISYKEVRQFFKTE